jgi:dipeptidase
MACDIVVALGRATAERQTLFGQNSDSRQWPSPGLVRAPGRQAALGERVRTQFRDLDQARQTFTLIGSQPEGWWGFTHGVNEHAVAIGTVPQRTRLAAGPGSLCGGDLVRLALERCRTARQSVDLLTNVVERHGLRPAPGAAPGQADQGFLIADASEAFYVEAAGSFWVYQEVAEVKAASGVCLIRQDWDRISPGLAGHVIDQGWWPADGSKIDFAGAVAECPTGEESGLRRWGRATLLLEQQNGHIDPLFFRRLLSDHYEGTHFEVDPLAPIPGPVPLCQHFLRPESTLTASSWVVPLGAADQPVLAWCAFGPPCLSLYFPVFLDGDLPLPLDQRQVIAGQACFRQRHAWLVNHAVADPEFLALTRESLGRLQARFDAETEGFLVEAAALKRAGDQDALRQGASEFMHESLDELDRTLDDLLRQGQPNPVPELVRHH